ncbi:hemagglutinin repeat-containing protein [Rhodanobacter terrae]|uniref:Hemagglutinin repeat-containing protein n=1 Tax=Rhodanobacter terrae TaxID=418647 RepID=A0ABW0T206_9GAMM
MSFFSTQAVQIAGTPDVALAAGHNLTLSTANDTQSESQGSSTTINGYQRSGLSAMVGQTKTTASVTTVTPVGTLVGSTNGAVTLSAGKNVHLTDADVISQTGTTIVGQNVTIDAAIGSTAQTQSQSMHSAGVKAGLSGGVATVAQNLYAEKQGASQTSDTRVKALYAAQAAQTLFSPGAGNAMGLQGQTGAQAATSGNTQGVSLRIGIGASSASSRANTYDETAYGSQISSAGNVTIAATNGDLHVIGSQINGNNVALSATNNISLLSQAEQHTDTSSSHNGSGEIGYSMGAQTGFYVTASAGEGQGHGNGTTYADSAVTAANTLSLVSGNNTTIEGAQAKGNTVLAAIGGNLDITSQQTTNAYNSSNWQAGGTFVYGSGGSVSISAGNTKSNYASVDQVSGIGAGSGGYAIGVNGNTSLTGGVIASTAAPGLNLLSTGTLTYSDLKNQASYSAMQGGISGGYSSGGGASATPSLAVPQSGNASGVTQAGIAQGTIDVRDNPTQDLSGLNRHPDLNATGLNPIFNAQTVANNQLAGQLAGQVGMTATGDVEQTQHLAPGSAQAVALHTVVGAATAALGGGNALQGALGAGASEAANNVQLTTNPTEQRLLSAGIGTLVGGGTGAATALDGTIYNDQHHFANYLGELDACQKAPSGSGCGTILAMQGDRSIVLSTADSSNSNGVIANINSQTGEVVSYTITNAQGQPTIIMQPSDYKNYLAIVGVGSNFFDFIGNNSPEYALQGSNAVTDAINGQGVKAAGNFVGMFTNGAYWRDMGIGMTTAVGLSLPSSDGVVTTSTGALTRGVTNTPSPVIANATADAEAGGYTVLNPDNYVTNSGQAVFWSGRTNGVGGAGTAGQFASSQGGTTLEQLAEANGINLPVWDPSNLASVQAWEIASQAYANNASGTVNAVIGNSLRPNNVWETVELPALKANPNVTQIIQTDPATGVSTVIFKR